MSSLFDMVALLRLEVARMRRTMARQMRFGTIAEVDTAKARARLLISDPDGGAPMLSPWLPWAEVAGQTLTWRPPVVGQQMMLFAPAGDMRRGLMVPATFSDQYGQPSDDATANRETLGGVTIDVAEDSFSVTAPAVNLGASGGEAVARKGDKVLVNGIVGEIIEGSGKVFSA